MRTACVVVFAIAAVSASGQHRRNEIDASIPLQGRPVEAPDVGGSMERAARIRLLRQQIEANELALDAAKRKQEQPKQEAAVTPDSDMYTCGSLNGRAWKSIPNEWKTAYLRGFVEGLGLTVGKDGAKYFPVNLDMKEAAAGVDKLYSDPANLLIPVVHSIQLLALRVAGEAPDALERAFAAARGVANKCSGLAGQ